MDKCFPRAYIRMRCSSLASGSNSEIAVGANFFLDGFVERGCEAIG